MLIKRQVDTWIYFPEQNSHIPKGYALYWRVKSVVVIVAEIEAAEACKWLRAAGFPQYAQMYEGRSPSRTGRGRGRGWHGVLQSLFCFADLQFPIDVSGVQKDHPFLDPDSLQSLFRRLQALNRCAKMKVDNLPKNKVTTTPANT